MSDAILVLCFASNLLILYTVLSIEYVLIQEQIIKLRFSLF